MRGDTTETSNLDRILQQIQIQNSTPSSFPPSDMSTRTDIGLLQPQQEKSLPWWNFSKLPVWEGTLPGTPDQAAYHLTELAKDVTPVVGPYRSAVRSGIEAEKAKSLLQEGKYIDAISPSIWSGLESLDASLSAIPVVGAAATLPIDLARTAKNTLFTSPAQKAVSEVSQEALPGKQWLKQLEGRGVKKDELEWTGLLEFLSKEKGNIPKSVVDDFIEANKIDVREVIRGGRPEINQDSKYVHEVLHAWKQSNRTFNDTRLWLTNDEGIYKSLMENFPELRKMEDEGKSWEDYIMHDVFGGLDWEGMGKIMRKHDIPGDIDPGENTVSFAQRVLREYGDRLTPEEWNYFRSGIEAAQRTDEALIAPQPELQLPGGDNYRELVLTLPNTKLEKAGREVLEFERQFGNNPIPEEFQAKHQRLRQAVADAKNEVGTYTGGHFPEDNVLAHIRFNERITSEGESMLFIEEMQSDWAHRGLDQGFNAPMDPKLRTQLEKELAEKQAELEKAAHTHFRFDPNMTPDRRPSHEVQDLLHQINVTPEGQFGAYLGIPQDEASRIFGLPMEIGALESRLAGTGVPRAPFVTDTHQWTNLGLKRMIKYAAENGFDSIAWTTGKQQGKRYHKLKPVRSIRFKKAQPELLEGEDKLLKKPSEDLYVIQAFEGKNLVRAGVQPGINTYNGGRIQLANSKTHFTEAEIRKIFGDDIADEVIAPTKKSENPAPKLKIVKRGDIDTGKLGTPASELPTPETSNNLGGYVIRYDGPFVHPEWGTMPKDSIFIDTKVFGSVDNGKTNFSLEEAEEVVRRVPETVDSEYRSLKDLKGLEVGGEYGKFIYDKVMTEQAKKIGKKYGVKVEKTNLHGSGEKSWLEKNDDAGGYDLHFYEDGEVHQVNVPIEDRMEAEKFADTFINTEIRDGKNVSILEPGDPPKVEDFGRLRYEVRDIEGNVVDAYETKEAAQQAADDLSWERGDTHGGEVYDQYEEAYELWEKRAQKSQGQEVWTMKLTDKLMKAAKEGLPYYALVPPGLMAVGAQREQRERQSLLE